MQTLSEYSAVILPSTHPTTKRVRAVAARIVESSGLGRMKTGGEMGAVEGKVPAWGGGQEVNLGEVMFGGGEGEREVKEGKDVEWEVSC
jgi:hypothetical protein